MKKIKVLHIFGELKPSGGEAMLLSAAPLWLRETEGHILSTGPQAGVYAPKLEAVGYRIHHIAFAKRFSFFFSVARLLRRERFDVIHLHTERASTWYALTARLAVGYSPFILRTVHHIFKFRGWLRVRKYLERQAKIKLFHVKLISNSPSGQRNELNRYRVRNQLIPNWYDSDYYLPPDENKRRSARLKLGFPDNLCVFMSLGGNWSYKNFGLIVEALKLVPDALSILYVQVGVQGDGKPLEVAAERLGVADRLRCAGVVDDPLLYLYAADVFLMPSSEEGFGVAAAEAMAAGLPTILSDVEALCDFRETVRGICYIVPSVSAIALEMARMARMSPDERRSLGRRLAHATRSHYGLDVGPRQYVDVYRQGLRLS